MDSFINQAFHATIKDAKPAGSVYVCLMESVPFYGGPEEGGWWGEDRILHAYREYPTMEQAEAARDAVQKLADELKADSQRAYGDHCLRTMEWLDARGLDADFLPEEDGPSDYYVCVCEELPTNSYGERQYA